ncbi:murein biosynthesis integral membrane protein MurJ [Glycomyces artemisiae]|uniref:Putative peptidoglycan lipid II flippase n=1 Tax=Glycomyces artemisiae TaxID=1076443 RepID=A0A2T0UUW6_9ACTN|nr:lipid II flippase MurJ [Glycomyces artemisiae]PRY61684.1 putative peptidoglycan lipid II flippase [Glycomyces artemisiae]
MTSARTLLGRSSLIAVGALSSRITGFIRTAAIGAALGAGLVGDAYTTAVMLPGIVYEILLGGIGTAVLVPLLNQARANHQDGGREFAQRLFSFAAVAFGLAALVATAAVPLLIPLLGGSATHGESANLTTAFAMFTVPAVFFYGIGAVATAILNARGTFTLPAWSPACNNLTLITAALALIAFPASDFGDLRTILLGGATLIGAALQALILIPAMRKAGVPWRWKPSLRGFGLRKLSKTILWVTAYVAAGQLGLLVILGLIRAAAAEGGPGPLIYNNAWVLLMMAYGILALPVITALTPELSKRIRPDSTKTANEYQRGVRLLLMLTAPAVAAMIALAEPIAVVLFEWSDYTHSAALATGPVIAAAGLALIPYSISQLQFFTFLAIGDARTPALIVIWSTIIRVALSLAVFALVPAAHLAAVLMLVNAIAYTIVSVASAHVLHRLLAARHIVAIESLIKWSGGIAVLLVFAFATEWAASVLVTTPRTAALLTLIGCAPVFATTYLLAFRASHIRISH